MFAAYKSQDREGLRKAVEAVGQMPAQAFQQMKVDDLTLLHHAAADQDSETIQLLSSLPYFKEVVNSNNNEEELTPLHLAASNLDHAIFLIENGADPLAKTKE